MTRRFSATDVLARAVIFLGVALALLGVVWLLRFLIAPLLLALLMSYCLRPVVDLLENRGLSRPLAVLALAGGGLALLVLFAFLAWPALTEWLKEQPRGAEAGVLEARLNERLAELQTWLTGSYPRLDWPSMFGKLKLTLAAQRRDLLETLPAFALGALSSAGAFLLAPILGLFVLLDGLAMKKAIVALVPNRYFETTLVLLHRVDRQISGYLRGAASESAIVTITLGLILFFLGMPDALLFAALYGAANVIPIAGPLLGASAGLIFSLLEPRAPSAGALLLAYGAVYAVDAMLINPLLVGKNLNLHPLTILVGLSVGGHLGGILGMLAAVPSLAICKAVFGTIAGGLKGYAQP